jgi:type IV pilus assembly protein PilA
MIKNDDSYGFTLIEVLLVMGIITIMASIVIIAINPARQLAISRNNRRLSNINTILSAVHQYTVDNRGNLPAGISTSTPVEICTTGVATATCSGAALTNLAVLTANELYLTAMPNDPGCPNGCHASGIGYKIFKSVNGRITVTAPNAELGATLSVTR